MTSRASDAFTYNAENRLTQATVGGVVTQYVYNADGARVKKTVSGTATYYIGNWYEVTNGTATKYYYFVAQRVAMRNANGVTYLHGDHLGSTSVASTDTGAFHSRQTYYAFGVPRTTEGTLPTDFTFTGQRADGSAGLMYYNARYYDAAIGRFVQPDNVIPKILNPQDLNRYSYGRNNPIRYKDPTGHFPFDWLIDVFSIAFDIGELWSHPSWENAGWLAADVVLGVVPYVPAGAGPAAKALKATEKTVKVVDKVGDAAHALDAAKDLIKGGISASERTERIKAILSASVKGEEKTRAVIGYFPEYTKANGKYFDVPPEVWEEFKKCGAACDNIFWEINEQFLKDMVMQGMEIHVERAARKEGPGLTKEIKFLDDLVKDGYLYYDDARDVYITITSPW